MKSIFYLSERGEMRRFSWQLCIVAALSALFFIAASGIVDPPISFRGGFGLVSKSTIGNTNRHFVVEATGQKEVELAYATVGGVLLQSKASPASNRAHDSIDLSWRHTDSHDAALLVSFGQQSARSDVPAWIWAVAAEFADHSGTAAVTLFDKPRTADERAYNAELVSLHGLEPYWIGYHPALDDTLVGFILFTADAMLVAPQSMRSITTRFDNIGSTFDYFSGSTSRFSTDRSVNASNYLIRLRESQVASGSMNLTYMLNDIDTKFEFHVRRRKLMISGEPNYHFGQFGLDRQFQEDAAISTELSQNRRVLYDLNPAIYGVVDEFARMAAFFRHVKETDPAKFNRFVESLEEVRSKIPTIETPAAWCYWLHDQ